MLFDEFLKGVGEVSPHFTRCRMWKDLEDSFPSECGVKSWYVFTGDWGGQILATVPVGLVPKWVGRRRMRRALRAMDSTWDPDSLGVLIAMDMGAYPRFAEWKDDPEAYDVYMDLTCPWVEHKRFSNLPHGVVAAAMDRFFEEPLAVADASLAGWKQVGAVEGGMGGGRLLDGEAWFHYAVLYRGEQHINEIRRLLGLPKASDFNLTITAGAIEHCKLMLSVGVL